VPDGLTPGMANFAVTAEDATRSLTGMVQYVAPALFTKSGTGTGVADATAVVVSNASPEEQTVVPVFNCDDSGCTSVPIAIPDDASVYVTFNATGVRNIAANDNVNATLNGMPIPVTSVAPDPEIPGLDHVTVRLDTSLRGQGDAIVALMADGQVSNVATINLQ
jgi:uncharacterized protein (TIGR03437 family)